MSSGADHHYPTITASRVGAGARCSCNEWGVVVYPDVLSASAAWARHVAEARAKVTTQPRQRKE